MSYRNLIPFQGSSPTTGGGVVNAVFNGGGDVQGIPLSSPPSVANLSDVTTEEPRTVLRVIVENMVYAMTLDTMKQVNDYFALFIIMSFILAGCIVFIVTIGYVAKKQLLSNTASFTLVIARYAEVGEGRCLRGAGRWEI